MKMNSLDEMIRVYEMFVTKYEKKATDIHDINFGKLEAYRMILRDLKHLKKVLS